MARNYEEREIDGHTWTVQQWGASFGLKMLSRIGNVVGGPIGKAISGIQGSGKILDAEINTSVIGDAISELLEKVDGDQLTLLFKDILRETRCDGKEIYSQFDLLFMGKYQTLIKVVIFAVGVNIQVPLLDLLTSLPILGGEGEPQLTSISGVS